MTVGSDYRYALRLFRQDGTVAGEGPIEVDWAPAWEWVRWEALRRGRSVGTALVADATTEPVWHPQLGAPWIGSVRVATSEPDRVEAEIPVGYFTAAADRLTKALVEQGSIAEGEVARYLPLGFARTEGDPPAAERRSRVVAPRIAVASRSLSDARASETWEGAERHSDDVPVLIPDRVLEEASAIAIEQSGSETGGVLIGHLRRDSVGGDLFLEVTAQVPARHTEATSAKLTFTAETWSDAKTAIELRGRDEIQLGWWHVHPVKTWCRCPPEKRPNGCPLGRGFLSADDRALHRTVFARAFNVALVVSEVHEPQPTLALFGWRRGTIERRGFQRVGARDYATAR